MPKSLKIKPGSKIIRPLKIDKPWGSEVILERNRHYTVKLITIWPGKRTSKQVHRSKVESVYVVCGYVTILGKNLNGGGFIHIPAGTVHRFAADDDAFGCELLEISHGLDSDIERLEDDYGRK